MKVLLSEAPGDLKIPGIAIRLLATAMQRYGHDVRVIWLGGETAWQERLFEAVCDLRPDLIGLSVYCSTVNATLAWLADYRRRLPGCTEVVVGGPQARHELAEPSHAARMGVDFVPTELDLAKPELCRAPTGVHLVRGVRLDDDLVPVMAEWTHGYRTEYPILTSRGCGNACSFCGLDEFVWQPRPDSALRNELRELGNFGTWPLLTVWDPSFASDAAHALCATAAIAQEWRRPWRINGVCLGDLAGPDLLEALADAGCQRLYVGIERVRDGRLFAKGQSILELNQAAEIVGRAKELGLRTIGAFVCGLPGDTEEAVMASFQASLTLALDDTVWGHAVPLPGTPLWRFAHRHGHVLRDYRDTTFQNPKVCFETPEFPAEARARVMDWIQASKGGPVP